MRVVVQPDFGRERFNLDLPYNDTVQNLLAMVSVRISDVPVGELSVYYQGQPLGEGERLDTLGVKDDAVVELRHKKRSEYCCSFL